MKKYLLFILGLIPLSLVAQRMVILALNQPPVLGFEATLRDLTITRGDSVLLGSDLKITGGSGNYSFKWSPGSTLNDSTIMKPVGRPVKNTTYILTTTDKNGCSFSVDYKVTVKPPTPVNIILEGSEKLDAWIYPNPGEGTLKIHLKGKPAQEIRFILFDNLGRIMLNYPVYDFEGDLIETLHLQLSPGIYSLVVRKEDYSITKLIIIK